MSKVYLIRHGQSQANLKRIWGGDFPLTEEGNKQALSVPGKIPVMPEKIVTSLLQRVISTADIAYPDIEKEKNPVFNEITFGDIELKPMTEELIKSYHNDPENFQRSINGEDRIKRAEEAICAIKKYAAQNENTAIFLSNTLLISIITVLLGKTLLETRKYYMNNCGVITLEYDGALKITDSIDLVMYEDK